MTDPLSSTFAALADPTRRALLARLAKGEANVSSLAKPFAKSMSLPAITKHLKVLEHAGLIRKTRDAQWRNCTLRAAPLRAAAGWIDDYRHHWEQRLDRLGDYLAQVQSAQPSPMPTARLQNLPKPTKAKGSRHARQAK
ncbi:MAG: helix-turn-helix transcriptional regulator [Myxococcales bacterium]|nr:helix-turn-helix transcriptional regulator [Myxococcales bacterium]